MQAAFTEEAWLIACGHQIGIRQLGDGYSCDQFTEVDLSNGTNENHQPGESSVVPRKNPLPLSGVTFSTTNTNL
jgi:hypothetical protein